MVFAEALSTDVTDINGYGFLGELRYGGNGATYGTPEYDAGTADDATLQRTTWDPNTTDGLDSGWRNLSLDVNLETGQILMSLQGGDGTASYQSNAGAFSSISQIQLRADVTTQAEMEWQGLGVTFSKDGVVTESAQANHGLDANVTDQSGATAEDLLTITPTASDNNQVHITAQVRMTSPSGVYPDDNSIFSQVFVFAQ